MASSIRPSTNACDHQPVWPGPRTAWALQISGRTRSLFLIWLLGWPDRRRGDRRISPGMWLLRAVKGWISIHHRSFSVALHLSVWFRQTVCQEYSNFGVLLEEVDEPLGVPMDKRLGWFPVVVTGIKALPLTQKFPFALGVTSCFNNPLGSYFPPSMTRSDKCFAVQKRGLTRSLGEGISLLRRSPETSISLLTSTRILHCSHQDAL